MDANEHKELKEALSGLGTAYEEFKATVEKQNEEIKKAGEASGETKQELARINDELNKHSEVKTRIEKLEAALARGAGSATEEGKTADDLPEVKEYRQALVNSYLKKGSVSGEQLEELCEKAQAACPEMKALRSNSNPDGGYWVTPDTSGRTVQKIFETSPIRPYASVQAISTDSLEGQNDYGEAGTGWEEDEQTAGDETSTPQIGKWRIPVHTMYSRPKISQKLLEDANLNVEAWLMEHVTRAMVRKENTAFVEGSGAGRPRGFLTYSDGTDITAEQIEQYTTAVSGTIDDTDILETVYKLKADYRANAAWACSRFTIGQIRQIQDDDGRFVWQPGLIAGEPDRLAGYPVLEMNDIPDLTNGALSMVFADWGEFYQIVDRIGMSVLRDPYSAKPMIEFYVRRRVGGAVINFEAGKIVKVKA